MRSREKNKEDRRRKGESLFSSFVIIFLHHEWFFSLVAFLLLTFRTTFQFCLFASFTSSFCYFDLLSPPSFQSSVLCACLSSHSQSLCPSSSYLISSPLLPSYLFSISLTLFLLFLFFISSLFFLLMQTLNIRSSESGQSLRGRVPSGSLGCRGGR